MTDRYAWLGPRPEVGGVALVAQATYHLRELDLLAGALRHHDVPVGVLVPIVRWKPLHRLRPGVRRLEQMVAGSGRSLGVVETLDELVPTLGGLVVMNDWGVPRLLVEAARSGGVRTYGWDEGVQDYEDVDTGQARRAYRTVDHVFALGEASSEVLGPDRSTIVGNARLASAWAAPCGPAGETVVVNSNFTYGVLTEHRRAWVDGVVRAAEGAGRPWVLSRHPAERGRARLRVTRAPVEELLAGAGTLVSRFSTVCLDALAMGVELVYHNPHGEKVPTFDTPDAGFEITASTDRLEEVLRRPPRPRDEVRAGAESFLRRHVLLDQDAAPSDRAAVVIAADLAGRSA